MGKKRRVVQVHIRVTEEEHKQMRRQAKKRGRTLSKDIRALYGLGVEDKAA